MPEIFNYEKRYKYPHMMPGDVEIWERFIEANPTAYDKVSYDVKVGSVPSFDTTVNHETGGNADNLYRRKIDVLGYKGEHIDVIELKPRAGTSAVGQVKGYGKLYEREYSAPSPVGLVIITNELLPDMTFLSESEGVRLIIV